MEIDRFEYQAFVRQGADLPQQPLRPLIVNGHVVAGPLEGSPHRASFTSGYRGGKVSARQLQMIQEGVRQRKLRPNQAGKSLPGPEPLGDPVNGKLRLMPAAELAGS